MKNKFIITRNHFVLFFMSKICFDSFDLTRFFFISEWLPKSFRSPLASQSNVIALTCDGRVEMLDKNTLAPFKFIRGVKTYIFSFKYAKVNDHLSLMNQLRRAATLPPIEQNGMIATIVYSIQSRSSFDHCWLETAQEQILHKVTLVLEKIAEWLSVIFLYFRLKATRLRP